MRKSRQCEGMDAQSSANTSNLVKRKNAVIVLIPVGRIHDSTIAQPYTTCLFNHKKKISRTIDISTRSESVTCFYLIFCRCVPFSVTLAHAWASSSKLTPDLTTSLHSCDMPSLEIPSQNHGK